MAADPNTDFPVITGTIRKIAVMARNTDITSIKATAAGQNFVWSGIPTALVLGDETDFACLDSGNVKITPINKEITIQPPLSQNAQGEIVLQNGVKSVGFNVYSVNGDVMLLSSTASLDSGDDIITEGTTITYLMLAIEYTGIGVLVLPKVRIAVDPPSGAVDKLANIAVSAKVFGTVEYPSGHYFISYADAGSGEL